MSKRKQIPTPKSKVRTLTEREGEIFKLAAAGYENARVAERLGISVKTVEAHKHSVLVKLGVSTTAELIKKYGKKK